MDVTLMLYSDHRNEKKRLLFILEDAFGEEFLARKEAYVESLKRPSTIYLIKHGKTIVGTLEIKRNAEGVKPQLSTFGIAKEYQGQGIGTEAVRLALKMVGPMWVCNASERGARMYRKFPEMQVFPPPGAPKPQAV